MKTRRNPLQRTNPRRLTKALILFLLSLTSWALVAWIGALWLSVSKPLPRADALVVLSGSRAYRERTEFAASLYRNGVAPIVLLTNDGERASWSNEEERNPPYHELAVRELEKLGVPGASIVFLNEPVNGTMDEATVIKKYASQNRMNTLLLVTSEYHSRRALWTFERAFSGSEIRIGVQSPGMGRAYALSWWFRPQGWRTVGAEFVKMLYYRISV